VKVPAALTGCEVWRIAFDYQVRLTLIARHPDEGYRVDAELVIETSFVLSDAAGEWHQLDPGTGSRSSSDPAETPTGSRTDQAKIPSCHCPTRTRAAEHSQRQKRTSAIRAASAGRPRPPLAETARGTLPSWALK
jgi:hypothetical protein